MQVRGETVTYLKIVVCGAAQVDSLVCLLRAASQADGYYEGGRFVKLSAEDQLLAEKLLVSIREV